MLRHLTVAAARLGYQSPERPGYEVSWSARYSLIFRGTVLDDGAVLTLHRPPLEEEAVFAGHLLVTPKRHVLDFAALDVEESAVMGIAIAKDSRLLKQLGAARVYLATVGHHEDHLHVHLLPRWPETPPDVPWHSVDDWDGARRATAGDIEELIAKLLQ